MYFCVIFPITPVGLSSSFLEILDRLSWWFICIFGLAMGILEALTYPHALLPLYLFLLDLFPPPPAITVH